MVDVAIRATVQSDPSTRLAPYSYWRGDAKYTVGLQPGRMLGLAAAIVQAYSVFSALF